MPEIIELDGSMGEGGGQILRTAVSLSTLFQRAVHIINIRAGRKEPGLRPQHLQALLAASRLCKASLQGAMVGSTELRFTPGTLPRRYQEKIDTGTAGSVTLIAQTLLPISIFGGVELELELIGGTEVPGAPTVDYLTKVVLPLYQRLGTNVTLDVHRRGYYPRGGGSILLKSQSNSSPTPLRLTSSGNSHSGIELLSVSRALPEHVAKRQLEAAAKKLSAMGITPVASRIDAAGTALSPGSSILIHKVAGNCFVGASALGERGKKAEHVGEEAAVHFLREIACNPTVDSHLADMLASLLPCIAGHSEFTTSEITNHLRTNMQVAQQIIPSCTFEVSLPTSSQKCCAVTVFGSAEKSN